MLFLTMVDGLCSYHPANEISDFFIYFLSTIQIINLFFSANFHKNKNANARIYLNLDEFISIWTNLSQFG